jgi:hypothetical protein
VRAVEPEGRDASDLVQRQRLQTSRDTPRRVDRGYTLEIDVRHPLGDRFEEHGIAIAR